MEQESFEDAGVAQLLNDTFIGKLQIMALAKTRAPIH